MCYPRVRNRTAAVIRNAYLYNLYSTSWPSGNSIRDVTLAAFFQCFDELLELVARLSKKNEKKTFSHLFRRSLSSDVIQLRQVDYPVLKEMVLKQVEVQILQQEDVMLANPCRVHTFNVWVTAFITNVITLN